MNAGVRLFVGGHAHTIAGEPYDLGGDRCFSAVHPPPLHTQTTGLHYLLDSGAFSDPPDRRLTPEAALDRQLAWESQASDRWGRPVVAEAIVSYDLLIDEVWVDGKRAKRRWSVADAEAAVDETVTAARYLAGCRRDLSPRALVLSCQGVDADQYTRCITRVLDVSAPEDWIGFGGWCILGRWTSWLAEFRRMILQGVPLIAEAGIRHIHLFGVLFEPALAALLWIADQYTITVSTDSTAPVLAATRANPRKAGMRGHDWRSNVAWWKRHLQGLRASRWYREPEAQIRQLTMFSSAMDRSAA